MTNRITAMLGLLAFTVTVMGGLIANNSFEFIITRALWSMGVFCLIGMIVGGCANKIIRDYRSKHFKEIFGYEEGQQPPSLEMNENSSTDMASQPIQQ